MIKSVTGFLAVLVQRIDVMDIDTGEQTRQTRKQSLSYASHKYFAMFECACVLLPGWLSAAEDGRNT